MKRIIFFSLQFFLSAFCVLPQNQFSLEEYQNFLDSHQNLSSQELTSIYNIGEFLPHVRNFPADVLYLDSVKQKFSITDYENQLLQKNGFVVTERISKNDFVHSYEQVWTNDLPVFISTDAILNAFHRSYDLILKSTELDFLIPKLHEFLTILKNNFHVLDQKYSANEKLLPMLKDIDLYITVPLKLLQDNAALFYTDNNAKFESLLSNINSLTSVEEPIFGEIDRKVDYSQFKPRGHYTDENYPMLASYWKAMIWFGRIELYLISPVAANVDPALMFKDVQRQTIDSYMVSELISISDASEMFNEIETTIQAFVGGQDNVTLDQLNSVVDLVNINSAVDFLDSTKVVEFQDTLASKSFAGQKILSQILESDPYDLTQIKPASAFLLFGQKFVIDSYVAGNVVYDRIIYNNAKIMRMLPSTLDILFALGNSASAQLLKPDLDKYHYSSNLALLRYLIDSYESDFWNNSIYNLWLNSIRTLDPPEVRTIFPQFMQTAAWWQEKMNTQLASWTELRHDNLLYAKQSYSGYIVCSFPYGYVEPIPNFFDTMKNLADLTAEKFASLPINMASQINFFNGFAGVMDTLETVAKKELNNTEFTQAEKDFLQEILYTKPASCGGNPYDGWYYNKLLYKGQYPAGEYSDYVVADYHTAPSDESGMEVGWVAHAGTGPANLCVVVAELPGVGNVAFCGPVSSYYEYTTEGYQRVTDKEWKDTYLDASMRPDWVNIYLADKNGESKGSGSSLITGVEQESNNSFKVPDDYVILQNYPNPFNPETTIRFTIPSKYANSKTVLEIYDINGRLIKKLMDRELPSGNYLVKWNGKNNLNRSVSSGVYIYQLKVGTVTKSAKMSLVR